MSWMQITNSPSGLGEYLTEFREVLAEAVGGALGLDSMIAGLKVSGLYDSKTAVDAAMVGRELHAPTPVAVAAMAINQFSRAKVTFGKVELVFSREKRELLRELERVALYCMPVLMQWPQKDTVVAKVREQMLVREQMQRPR